MPPEVDKAALILVPHIQKIDVLKKYKWRILVNPKVSSSLKRQSLRLYTLSFKIIRLGKTVYKSIPLFSQMEANNIASTEKKNGANGSRQMWQSLAASRQTKA